MKKTKKKQPISTAPKGMWEGSTTNKSEQSTKAEHEKDIRTDLQENGYPDSKKKKTRTTSSDSMTHHTSGK